MRAAYIVRVVDGVFVTKTRRKQKKKKRVIPTNTIHDELVQTLEARLSGSGLYTTITKLQEYSTENACGEIDLYATTFSNRVLVFEMKGSDSTQGYAKAQDQLVRAAQNYHAFKHKDCILFYVYWTDYNQKEYGLERIFQ